jgi:hypothetical protein
MEHRRAPLLRQLIRLRALRCRRGVWKRLLRAPRWGIVEKKYAKNKGIVTVCKKKDSQGTSSRRSVSRLLVQVEKMTFREEE